MNEVNLFAALFLLGNIIAGLFRVLRGPTAADRMLAAQLFGTAGVAITLLLAEVLAMPDLRDVGLVFALLSAIGTVAFVKMSYTRKEGNGISD